MRREDEGWRMDDGSLPAGRKVNGAAEASSSPMALTFRFPGSSLTGQSVMIPVGNG